MGEEGEGEGREMEGGSLGEKKRRGGDGRLGEGEEIGVGGGGVREMDGYERIEKERGDEAIEKLARERMGEHGRGERDDKRRGRGQGGKENKGRREKGG